MATSDKCPICDCEGNLVGCETCFYSDFKCPGNCKCCADQKEPSTETQAITSNSNNQRESTQRQVRVSNSNDQRQSTQQQARAINGNGQRQSTQKQKRPPLRPLILRNVKKAVAENQKAACSNVSQSKAESSKASEPCTNKENSTVGESNENKVNPSNVKQPNKVMVNAETQTPKPQVTYVVEPEPSASGKELVKKENEELKRLWNNLFWPQWDKVPCVPHNPPQTENQRNSNIITKEKLEKGINELIGDHCLNCHCKNLRDPCEICRRTDYQCLGTCKCCLSFRAGQRYMIYITRGLFQLSDGSIYGGGSVNLSLVVPRNSEVTEDASNANNQILNLSKAVTATAVSAFLEVIFITLNRITTLLPGMLMNMRQTLLTYF